MTTALTIHTENAAVAKIDNGKPALYNPAAFDQIWRASKLFASSDLVPTAYKNKPENCFIAIEMADRMGISPFAMLQSLVIIQGKPSMEAKLIIALVNDSGIFEDPLDFEVVGDDPHAKNFKVRAVATMKKTGKLCQGPWITYQMVEGEGWLGKQGSKWKTMPDLMFRYRAASYFAKIYASNITMGMQTREEMEDVKPIDITPERKAVPALVAPTEPENSAPALVSAQSEIIDTETGEITEAPEEVAEPATESAEQKQKQKRRTKAEIGADKAAQEPPAHVLAPPTEDDFLDPPDAINQTAEIMRDNPPPTQASNDEEMGDLF
jgi:hypothetical protein